MQDLGYFLVTLGAVLLLIAFGGVRIKFWVAEVETDNKGPQPPAIVAGFVGIAAIIAGAIFVIIAGRSNLSAVEVNPTSAPTFAPPTHEPDCASGTGWNWGCNYEGERIVFKPTSSPGSQAILVQNIGTRSVRVWITTTCSTSAVCENQSRNFEVEPVSNPQDESQVQNLTVYTSDPFSFTWRITDN
jgi:hypothetical protein